MTPPAQAKRLPKAISVDEVERLLEAAGSTEDPDPRVLRIRALLEGVGRKGHGGRDGDRDRAQRIGDRAHVLGKHHLTLLCLGRSLDEMERCVQDVTTAVQNLGVTVIREDMNAKRRSGANARQFFLYRARRPDFLAKFRRLRLAAQFRGRQENREPMGSRRSRCCRRRVRPRTSSISTAGRSATSRSSGQRARAKPWRCRS